MILRLSLFLLLSAFSLTASPKLYTEEAVKNATPPNPLSLKPSWWEYFNVEKLLFEKRAKNYIQNLENLKSTYPEQTPTIDRIIQGFYTLIDLENPQLAKTPPPLEYKNSYTISELENLAVQLSYQEKTLISQKLQLKFAKKNITDDRTYLDNLVAAYIPLSEDSEMRLEKGLEIILTKLHLEIESHQVASLESRKETTNAEIANAKKEIEIARGKLSSQNVNIAAIETAIQKAEQNFLNAHLDLDRRQRDFMAQERSGRLDEVTRSLYIQEMINLTILEALASVTLTSYQIELTLVNLINPEEQTDIKAVYQEIDRWRDKLYRDHRDRDDWKQGTLIELDKALQKLSTEQDATQIKRLQSTVSLAEESMLNLQKFESEKYLAEFLLNQTSAILRTKYSSFGERISNFWHAIGLFFKTHAQWFHHTLFKIGDTPLTPISILKFLIYLGITYLIAFYVRHSLRKLGARHARMSTSGLYALSRLAFYAIFLIGLIIAITTVGIDFTAIAVIAGALSVGIGFGLQSIVNNFVAGIILLLEKKVRIGDLIQLDMGDIGNVKEVNMRTTLMRTYDNLEVLIPNSEIISKKVTNWTLSDKTRRIRIPFGVAFGTDKEFLKQVVVDAAKSIPTTLSSPEPNIWLMSLGESSLNFELVVWVNEYVSGLTPMATTARYLWAIEDALRKNHIEIPYPVRDINLRNPASDGP